MSNTESIQNVNDDAKKWDWAIEEANNLLRMTENRAARLRGAIKTFTELRDSGQPWTEGQSNSTLLRIPQATSR
jgi:hypothetical protein